MRLAAVTSLVLFGVLSVSAEDKCHFSVAAIDDCLDGVERTASYVNLKNKERAIVKECLKTTSKTAPDCKIGSGAGEKCRKSAKSDGTLKAAKEKMYAAIDKCFDKTVDNPFAVLRMTGDMGALSSKRSSSRSKRESAFPFLPDTSDVSSQPAGPSTPSNCPAPSSDSSAALGGSSTDMLGGSSASDPTALLSTFTSGGGLGGGSSPFSSLLGGGLPGAGAGLPAAGGLSGAGGLGAGGLGGGGLPGFPGFPSGRKRRDASSDISSACKPVQECLRTQKKKYSTDQSIIRDANAVNKAVRECKASHSLPLNCLPNTEAEQACAKNARKEYAEKLKAFMTQCFSKDKTPNGQ